MADTFFAKKFTADEIRTLIGKRRPYMGLPHGFAADIFYLVAILFSVGLVLPFYLAVVLPIVALYWVLILLPRRLLSSPTKGGNKNADAYTAEPSTTNLPSLTSREFDVVVFGVTGLCGRITAEFLLAQYGADGSRLKIAFAGRSMAKLQAVRAELSNRTQVSGAGDVPLIVADSDDLDSLLALARRTRVIATSVGPYNKYGELLVKACAYSGTGYCDLTGEQDFVSEMAKKYGAVAKATGARIVHLTGVDSIPSEIMTTLVCEAFQTRYGHAPARVENVLLGMTGGLPGGTVDTVVNTLEGNGSKNNNHQTAQSSSKSQSTPKEPAKGIVRYSPIFPRYLESVGNWGGPWIMGPVNSVSVKRSNALAGFAPKIDYYELQAFPSLLCILAAVIPTMVGFTLFTLPPVRSLLFSLGVLPRPGDGPTRQQMAKGFMNLRTTAFDGQGNKVTMGFSAVGDPGCIVTAVLQGESAACLATECVDAPLVGAGLTPVAVMGSGRLADRLRKSGRILIE